MYCTSHTLTLTHTHTHTHFHKVFVKDNQGEEETTVIKYLGLCGSPLDTIRMEEYKRVSVVAFKRCELSMHWAKILWEIAQNAMLAAIKLLFTSIYKYIQPSKFNLRAICRV